MLDLYRRVTSMDLNFVDEVVQWSREYSKHGIPALPLARWTVGEYQIGQALRWTDSAARGESLAAAFIHIVGAGEGYGFDMAEYVGYFTFDSMPYQPFGWKYGEVTDAMLLRKVLKCSQLALYRFANVKGDSRWMRSEKLGEALSDLGLACIQAVPALQRKSALAEAMLSMSGMEHRR